MTIVSTTAIHLKADADWGEAQKQLKRGMELTEKHGGENVTVMATMAGGPVTGNLAMLYTVADWTTFGKVQDAIMSDPEMQALMSDPDSQTAGWDTYLSQTLDL